MNDKFFDLKKEKQDRMINACLKVFAKNCYDHASTDEMVKEAQISKGLLFHYFESKLGLYEFLFDYCAKYMMLETSSLGKAVEKDYFVVYAQLLDVKTQVAKTYPYMEFFLQNAYKDTSKDFSSEFLEKIASYRDYEEGFFGNVNLGYFNATCNYELLRQVVAYTANGLMEQMLAEDSFEPDRFEREITRFLDMLRAMSYQKI